ncbi:hypothetical protein CDAR_35181 [Caerostris darwini]|uniref:Uncharacterized protein n=1 Tax=Caerostris darwini TaxID=1538125 RepID=A0AAV4SP62_9ARAC|nr:hypothetical protein CDAR_35181 [Caerostris darwini]
MFSADRHESQRHGHLLISFFSMTSSVLFFPRRDRQGRSHGPGAEEGPGSARLPQQEQGGEGGPGDPVGHGQRQRGGQDPGPVLLRFGEAVRPGCAGHRTEAPHPHQQRRHHR